MGSPKGNTEEAKQKVQLIDKGGIISEESIKGAVCKAQKEGSTEARYYLALQSAFNETDNGEINVLNDVIVNKTLVIKSTITLDLNGKTIKNENELWNESRNDWSLISVRESGNLTITGNGHLLAKDDDCYGLDVQDGASLTIENGEIKGNISAVYVYEGELIIEGGKYSIQQLDNSKPYGFLLNCFDSSFRENKAKIEVKGGKFCNFNPGASNGEPTNPTSFVPDGYTVTSENVKGETWYTVTKSN